MEKVVDTVPHGDKMSMNIGKTGGICIKESGKNMITNTMEDLKEFKAFVKQQDKLNKDEVKALLDWDTKRYSIQEKCHRKMLE